MPTKKNVDALLRKNLGKEIADEVIRKIDKMAKLGATPAKIEKAISADLIAHAQKQVAVAVIAKSGPLVPIKAVTLKNGIAVKNGVAVKNGISVKNTTVANRPSVGITVKSIPIKVKVGPGPLTRGKKK